MEPHGQSPAFGGVPKKRPRRGEHPVSEDLFTQGYNPRSSWLGTETTEYFFNSAHIEDVSLCLVTGCINKIADSGTDVKQIFRRQHRATFGGIGNMVFVSLDSN